MDYNILKIAHKLNEYTIKSLFGGQVDLGLLIKLGIVI